MLAYLVTPRWARVLQRAFFSARYVMLGAAGIAAAIQREPSVQGVGWILIVGAWIALVGVATGRFQLELIPIWFILGALTWAAGVLFTTGRPVSGVLILALVPALAERLLHLMLVASRARRLTGDDDGFHHADR